MIARQFHRGLSVIEIVVAAAIIAAITTGIASAWQAYIKVSNSDTNLSKALLLAEEGTEAVQLMRDSGWTINIAALSLNTTYYLYWTGSAYAATTTMTSIGSFVRTAVFSQ